MDGKIAAIAASFMMLGFAPTANADHGGSETCFTPDEWEPDELCLTLAWNGPVERVQDTPNREQEPPLFYYGIVELTICVEICINNIPSAGVSPNPNICSIYIAVVVAGGSCTFAFAQPYYLQEDDPTQPPSDIVCIQQGRAAFYLEEHQSGPGISNIPIANIHFPDSNGQCPPEQAP